MLLAVCWIDVVPSLSTSSTPSRRIASSKLSVAAPPGLLCLAPPSGCCTACSTGSGALSPTLLLLLLPLAGLDSTALNTSLGVSPPAEAVDDVDSGDAGREPSVCCSRRCARALACADAWAWLVLGAAASSLSTSSTQSSSSSGAGGARAPPPAAVLGLAAAVLAGDAVAVVSWELAARLWCCCRPVQEAGVVGLDEVSSTPGVMRLQEHGHSSFCRRRTCAHVL